MVGLLDPPDHRKGGYFGHLFQLYDAIAAALDMWDDERARLIINLSLGWDSVAADEADLLGALTGLFQEASCRGALVIAAGESASKARRRYFPGYLRRTLSPRPNGARLIVLRSHDEDASAYTPLCTLGRGVMYMIYSSPRPHLVPYRGWQRRHGPHCPGPCGRVAYADNERQFRGGRSCERDCGAVWRRAPELSHQAVISRVYDAGVALPGRGRSRYADFCLAGSQGCSRWLVRRASLCGALKSMTRGQSLDCDDAGPDDTDDQVDSSGDAASIADPAPRPSRVLISKCSLSDPEGSCVFILRLDQRGPPDDWGRATRETNGAERRSGYGNRHDGGRGRKGVVRAPVDRAVDCMAD